MFLANICSIKYLHLYNKIVTIQQVIINSSSYNHQRDPHVWYLYWMHCC